MNTQIADSAPVSPKVRLTTLESSKSTGFCGRAIPRLKGRATSHTFRVADALTGSVDEAAHGWSLPRARPLEGPQAERGTCSPCFGEGSVTGDRSLPCFHGCPGGGALARKAHASLIRVGTVAERGPFVNRGTCAGLCRRSVRGMGLARDR